MNKEMKEAKFWLNRNYLFTRKVMAHKHIIDIVKRMAEVDDD